MTADEPSRKASAARPPHPATLQRKAAAPTKARKTRGPHAATVQKKAAAPIKSGKTRPPHPATVQKKATAPGKAAKARPPHAAATSKKASAPTKSAKTRPAHAAKAGRAGKTASNATTSAQEWDKNTLLGNLEVARGKAWAASLTRGLRAIVLHEGPNEYDSADKIVSIDSRQTEAEATQRLVVCLSRHQNRAALVDLDQSAAKTTRDEYIEKRVHLDFPGVINTLRVYDGAVKRKQPWAQSGCLYESMRGLAIEAYAPQVSIEQREAYGKQYDALTKNRPSS